MTSKNIEFVSQNLLLEGVLGIPAGPAPFAAVILCHPHPLFGGDMHNRVVTAICARLEEHGLAWLKFNFRGVGGSEGNFAGGIGEKEDARAAITFIAHQELINPEKIGICGYSFGSLVALQLAGEDPRIKAVAAISPFIEPSSLLNNYVLPKLFVCGTEDQFINPENLKNLIAHVPEPKELIFYSGEDHFWTTHEEQMTRKVSEFFRKHLQGAK